MFKLPPALTVHNVKAVREELLTLLDGQEESSNIPLDAGELNNLDATGLQLLIAFCSNCSKVGHNCELTNITPPLRQLLEFTGGIDIVENQ